MNIDDWRKQRQMKKEYNKVQDSGEPEEYPSHNNLSSHGRMPSLGYPSTTQDPLTAARNRIPQDTEQQEEHGNNDKPISTFGLRRADTENGKWATTTNSETETSSNSTEDVRKELEDRMYGSRMFRVWMRLVTAAAFGASGYAISVVTTAG